MFKRSCQTYEIKENSLAAIFNDPANPLNRINCLIPSKSKILDIGAGNGILADLLSCTHEDIVIDGIEPNEHAAEIASAKYRKFFRGDAGNYIKEILKEDYDFIVLADVIEHLADPESFLADICRNLSEKVRIIITVPNVSFGAIRVLLLLGHFDYVDSGILERTHLRFFTLRTLEKLIRNLNLNIELRSFLQRDFYSTEIDINKLKVDKRILRSLEGDPLAWTYQFLFVLTKENVISNRSCHGTCKKKSKDKENRFFRKMKQFYRV